MPENDFTPVPSTRENFVDKTGNYGGYFVAAGDQGRAVYGHATSEGALIDLGPFKVQTNNYGGYFVAEANNGRGVHAEANGANGIGIYATGGSKGIYATGEDYAADFRGKVVIRGLGGGTVMELGQGLDYAEGFDVSDKNEIGPGSVLVIDAENPGKLTVSKKVYDSKVAGIVAGAKNQGSGVRLGADQFDFDVALAGRVYCNVDATEAAVEPGDLLTTSATPGYATKAEDYMRAQGAILGKAMEKLEKGKKGQILVLVTLQ